MTIEKIEKAVLLVVGETAERVREKNRKKNPVYARHLVTYFARRMTKLSWRIIGEYYGKDYSTAIHSSKTIKNFLFRDKGVQKHVKEIEWLFFGNTINGDWVTTLKRDLTDKELTEFCTNCPQL